MTYLAILCLNIFLGIFIPGIIMYSFSKDYKSKNKTNRKKAKGAVLNKKDYIASLFLIVFMLGVISFSWYLAIPHWMDIPALVFKDYETKIGFIHDFYYEADYGNHKAWGFDYAYINNEQYNLKI